MEHTNDTVLRYFREYELSEDDLDKLKKILVGMLKDIHELCEQAHLSYMLCGGTLLGAIRHKGFIPWDDDVDIMMPRKDYDLLAQNIKDTYGDKYFVTEFGKDGCPFRMMKIMLNGTEYREILRQNHPYFCGIFVDVFPIDNIPEKHKFRAKMFNFYTKAFFAIQDYKFPSELILEKCKEHKELKKYYYKRRRVGAICNFLIGQKTVENKIKKLSEYGPETSLQGLPLGIYYDTEVFKAGTFDERIFADFCGERFYIPGNYDEYLKNLYGDYMKLPPEDKRRRHQVFKLDFGPYN